MELFIIIYDIKNIIKVSDKNYHFEKRRNKWQHQSQQRKL